MILKKKVLEEVELNTKRFKIQEMIENKIEFDGLVYKVRQEGNVDYFICLSHKKLEVQEEIADADPEENEDVAEVNNFDDGGLLATFDFGTQEPQKDHLFNEHTDADFEWSLIGTVIINNDGVIHDLTDYKKEIEDEELIRSLSIKECFLEKDLAAHNFEINKLDNDLAKEKYNESFLDTLFYPEQIKISLKEIFLNREHFPITKIEQDKEGLFTLQLGHSEILEYLNKENKNQNILEVINNYEQINEFQEFKSLFTKNI